ncbi:MAG: metal-dependent phosphohydrolase [Myxococcaceae bacterium]|nr:metal-dependent phosphohydrolase [Myxococcaceae bacterium]
MFAWLSRWFGGERPSRVQRTASKVAVRAGNQAPGSRTNAGNGQAASASSAKKGATTPGANVSKTGTSAARKPTEPYSDVLARELGEPAVLSEAEQQQTSELVEAISKYVGTHKIDPPVMPALASRMLELLREDEVDVIALARLIEKDQATSAKLMTMANSAMFKGNSEIEGVRDAILFLGTEQVAHIAIGLASRAMFESPKHQTKVVGAQRWSLLFNHGMTVAFGACHIASRRTRRHSESAFVGGLFHDVGKAVALRALTEVLAEKHQATPSEPVIDAVLQLIHSEPTAALYESWSLPRQVMMMCQNHHQLSVDVTPELHVVRLVSGLDTLRIGSAIDKRDVLHEIAESAAALRMSDAELRVAHTETKDYGERVHKMFT